MTDEYFGENQPAQRTTPTWEVELLISGATVLGLMQLPGPLSRSLVIWMNGNEEAIVSLLRLVSIYLQFSLVALIVTFVVHIAARGYWVALAGMYSVYPKGIVWEKNKSIGPILRDESVVAQRSTSELIERADNRASVIFGLGFGMAIMMLVASVIVAVMIAILMIVQALNGNLDAWSTGLWLVLAIILVPYFAAFFTDVQWGKKLQARNQDGFLKKVFNFYQRIGINSTGNSIMTIYSTNEGATKSALVMAMFMLPLMLAVALFTSTRGLNFDNGAYDGLPKNVLGAEHVIRPEYYASERGDEFSTTLLPYIEDSIVSGNFIRLFVPYEPEQHNALLKEQCPAALVRKASNAGEGLACLSKYFAIQIDDKAIDAPLLGARDGVTGQRGLIAMIDVRALGNGQHVLKIKVWPKNKKQQGKFHRIPFWK